MTRNVRIGLIVLGAVVVVGFGLSRLISVDSFRPKLESELSAALGRQVKVGDLSLSLFAGKVGADNISIADDPAFSEDPFVTAKSFSAAVKIMPLIFSKTLHITGIALEEPQIRLIRGPGGTWNFSNLGKGPGDAKPSEDNSGEKSGEKSGAPSSGSLLVDKLAIEKGRVVVGTANSAEKPAAYEDVNVEVTDFSSTTQFPFEVTAALPGGGDLNLKGKCGPFNGGNMAATPLNASLQIRKLDLAASGFVSPATGIAGLTNIDGQLASVDQQVKISGTLTAEKLKLAAKGTPMNRTVQVKFALDHNLKLGSGALTAGEAAIGKAVMHLTGTYQEQGPATALNMKATAKSMPVDELESALPALGIVLPAGTKLEGGGVSLDLAISGPSDKLVISGPIRMAGTKLAGFDLASKLSAIPGLSGRQTGDLTIQNLSATARVAPEGTQANAIDVNIPSIGAVRGAGTISPSGALDFQMRATLSGAPGGAVTKKVGTDMAGEGVPFTIQGTTSDPKFVPDVKSIASNVVKSKVGSAVSEKAGLAKLGGRRK
jgi:AsmA protein